MAEQVAGGPEAHRGDHITPDVRRDHTDRVGRPSEAVAWSGTLPDAGRIVEALQGVPEPLVAQLRDAAARGAVVRKTENGHLRLDLSPAFPDARDLARFRASLMPYAGQVAVALRAAQAGGTVEESVRAIGDRRGASHPGRDLGDPGDSEVEPDGRIPEIHLVRPEPPPTVLVETESGLRVACEAMARRGRIGLDTETTGLSPHRDRLRLVQLGAPDGAYVIDTWRVSDLAPLARLVADPAVEKVIQNARFDLGFLRTRGTEAVASLFDPMIASQLLSAGEDVRHNLKTLARRYLRLDLDKQEQASDWSGDIRPEQLVYAALDVSLLPPLRDALAERLAEAGLTQAADIEMRALPAVTDLGYVGMPIDAAALGMHLERLERDRADVLDRLREALPDAADRLTVQAPVLGAFRARGVDLPDLRLETLGLHAENADVAAYLTFRHIERKLAFLRSLSASVVPESAGPSDDPLRLSFGRVHPDYWQIGAQSGRMSCSGPNLQQVPRDAEIRRLFAAPPGRRLILADYSQVELRIVAVLSGDPRMLEAFARGEDLHRVTASLMTKRPVEEIGPDERQAAKAANFGLIYAMGARGLMEYARTGYGVRMGLTEAETLRQRFFEAYPGLTRWHAHVLAETRANGISRTVTGRLRHFPEGVRVQEAYNTPVQGSGADLFKAALGSLWPRLRELGGHLVGAVHDEILAEVPDDVVDPARELVARTMQEAAERLVPGVLFPVHAVGARTWADKDG